MVSRHALVSLSVGTQLLGGLGDHMFHMFSRMKGISIFWLKLGHGAHGHVHHSSSMCHLVLLVVSNLPVCSYDIGFELHLLLKPPGGGQQSVFPIPWPR